MTWPSLLPSPPTSHLSLLAPCFFLPTPPSSSPSSSSNVGLPKQSSVTLKHLRKGSIPFLTSQLPLSSIFVSPSLSSPLIIASPALICSSTASPFSSYLLHPSPSNSSNPRELDVLWAFYSSLTLRARFLELVSTYLRSLLFTKSPTAY